jgi:hypothetical protein
VTAVVACEGFYPVKEARVACSISVVKEARVVCYINFISTVGKSKQDLVFILTMEKESECKLK